MEEINEDELILYEESKEIVNKLLYKSPLLYEIQKSRFQQSLNDKENKSFDTADNNSQQKVKFEQNGKY